MAKSSKTTTPVKATKAETIDIGISASNLKNISQLLQACLADLHVLYIKTRNFHWNVEGMSFGPLHELFEKQYKEIESIIDEVAERIRNLGFFALGSLKGFSDLSRLKEHMTEGTSDKEMLRILAEDHETHIRSLRESIDKCDEQYNDVGTSDFLTDVLRAHEKMAWMLRVHLK
ncbi:MAG TPA: DNA starvation/stationary phase protection protein [Flavipsychrobacter sp.]|nr:DNA starvation/stationary phase protection protein [Flavipsychrobacter sp.]